LSYVLDIAQADQSQVQAEFMALLIDPNTGPDAAQLGLALQRLAQNGRPPPPPNSGGLHRLTYPSSGTCTAFYAFEKSGSRSKIYILGFCESTQVTQHYAAMQSRLANVP
jgi:hypothetical protein